uniref:Putative secreted protein n=1 Tax=Amblyomma cajennense TaxID=34607 RepID=A0A023FCP7_AMBCJ
MRAAVSFLAIFLASAVLYCDGRWTRPGDCYHGRSHLSDGDTKNAGSPCEKVKCTYGKIETIANCTHPTPMKGERQWGILRPKYPPFPTCCPY